MPNKRGKLRERSNTLLDGPSSPADELELVDLGVQLAALDERDTMFDPGTAPKPPDKSAEASMDALGERSVDMQRDTPIVDDVAAFDLSSEELLDVDL